MSRSMAGESGGHRASRLSQKIPSGIHDGNATAFCPRPRPPHSCPRTRSPMINEIMAHSNTVALLLSMASIVSAQQYDLVLKGGHVIDPANGIDAVMDVAVAANRIAAVGPNLPAAPDVRAVDVTGRDVVPGLIDLHMHVFGYEGSIAPDDTALPAGTTTVVDAGGSGWRTLDQFRATVIAHSKTPVRARLNIVA